ncbi:hypothetical protein JCM10207_008312 [Rhodosporidiobolus poonsookiae]
MGVQDRSSSPASPTLDALDREIASLETSPPQSSQPALDSTTPQADAGTALHDSLARRRAVMLGAACVLSVGSHFSTYVLGPIKKTLHTSEGGFAALISAFELLNTVTPLVSGFLVPRYGAAACGLVATGAVLLGQIIVCIAQDGEGGVGGNIGGMVFGLLIFGSGISPLAVVQETIILKHNSSSSKLLARSVALGLVLGKTASFAASWSSDRLHSISPRLPFLTAAGLSLFSFTACVLYAAVERSTERLVSRSATLRPSADDPAKPLSGETAHPHRPLHLSALAGFGDSFWMYIAVCGLAGTWYTSNHLASHFLQSVYALPQAEASSKASLLLATSTFLYPLIGWTLDKRQELLSKLWVAVPALTAATYFILLMLSAAIPPILALLPAAIGMGSGPLLLVLVVPRLVERHQAATALGAHKSLEMAGAIIFQTVCGLLLSLGSSTSPDDPDEPNDPADADYALSFLFVVALVMLAVVVRWWVVIRRKEAAAPVQEEERGAGRDEAEYGLLEARSDEEDSPERAGGAGVSAGAATRREDEQDGLAGGLGRREREELRRGKRALKVAAGVVVLSWGCFVVNLLR